MFPSSVYHTWPRFHSEHLRNHLAMPEQLPSNHYLKCSNYEKCSFSIFLYQDGQFRSAVGLYFIIWCCCSKCLLWAQFEDNFRLKSRERLNHYKLTPCIVWNNLWQSKRSSLTQTQKHSHLLIERFQHCQHPLCHFQEIHLLTKMYAVCKYSVT